MTKLSSFALAAALLAAAGAASAASPTTGSQGQVFFSADNGDGNGSAIEFGRVDAPAAGVVEVYEYRMGQVGRLMATEAVDAGTNWRVRVGTGPRAYDVIAVLKVDGETVAQRVVSD